MLTNPSFEESWTDRLAGNTKNQIPNGWTVKWKEPQEELESSGEYLDIDHPPHLSKVTTLPEITHKGFVPDDNGNWYWNVPKKDRPGGSEPLMSDGNRALHIFTHSGPFSASFSQVFDVEPGEYVGSIDIQVHHYNDYSPGAAMFQLRLGTASSSWRTLERGIPSDREPFTVTVKVTHEGGPLKFEFVCEGRTLGAVNFFVDNAKLRRLPDRPPVTRNMTSPGLHLTTGDSGASDEYRALHDQLQREFPKASEALIGRAMPPVKAYGTPELAETLRLFKEINPHIKTVFRLSSVPGSGWNIEGPRIDDPRAYMDVVYGAVEPYLDVIDVVELINEQDPVGVDGHLRLAAFMEGCAQYAEEKAITVGLFSYSLGVPEWVEIQAIVSTGVFDHNNIELHLHEYATPLWENYGQAIPGYGGDVSNKGPLAFRYRFWRELTDVPIAITELNLARMEDYTGAEWKEQMRWYLEESAKDNIDVYIFGWGSLGGSWLGFDIRPYRQYWYDLALLSARSYLKEPPLEPEGYHRVYVIADPTYMDEQQLTQRYDFGRDRLHTTGPSWDDAVPRKEDRPEDWITNTVLAGNVAAEDRQRYDTWVRQRDPDTELVFDELPTTDVYDIIPYSQLEEPHASLELGESGISVAKSGCLAVAVASWMTYYDPSVTPEKLIRWLNRNNGFLPDGRLILPKPCEYLEGMQFKDYITWRAPGQVADLEAIRSSLEDAPVIIQVDHDVLDEDLDSHFVVVVESSGDDLLIMDPWYGDFRWLMEEYPKATLKESIFAYIDYKMSDVTRPPVVLDTKIGINDPENQGAALWMHNNQVDGAVIIPIALGEQPRAYDFTDYNVDIYLNLRYGWSTDKGGNGTIPPIGSDSWYKFVLACVRTLGGSLGVKAATIGNEPNNPREGDYLTPQGVAETFNAVRYGMRTEGINVPIGVGALDPFYGVGAMNPSQWWDIIYEQVEDVDLIPVHGYVRGPYTDMIDSPWLFEDPRMSWQYLNYAGCIRTLVERLPSRFRNLPVIVTEFNHLHTDNPKVEGWVTDHRAGKVVDKAFDVAKSEGYGVLGVYRWEGDQWHIRDNSAVLDTIRRLG